MYSPHIVPEPTIVLQGAGWIAVAVWLIGTALATRRRPALGIVAIMATLPLYQARGNLGVPTTLLELTLLTVLLAYLTKSPRALFRRTPYDIPLAAWVLSGFLAACLSVEPLQGLGLWRAFFLEPVMAFYLLTAITREETNGKQSILYGAIGAVIVTAGLSIMRLMEGGAISYDDRFIGFFQSANYLALLMVPMALLIVAWPGRLLRLLRVVTAVGAVGLTMASNSRGGALALFAGLGVIALLRLSKTKLLVIGGLSAIAVLAAAWSGDGPLRHSEGQVVDARAVIWREAITTISEKPFLGNGPGGFQAVFVERVKGNETETLYVAPQAQSAHNLWLTAWTDWGLPALLSLLAVLAVFMLTVIRDVSPYRAVAIAMMTAIIVHGVFDTSILKNDLAVVFAVALSLSLTRKQDTV